MTNTKFNPLPGKLMLVIDQVNESRSEIVCFPEWEVNDHIDINELIDWLVKGDKWQEYDELKPAADIEL